jgi:hypothetical protein
MKKYIFTESQVKKIIDTQINEQTSEAYEGEIKTINGKTIVLATSEMGNTKQIPVKLKVKVADGTKVFVSMKNGQPEVWGGKPNQKLN